MSDLAIWVVTKNPADFPGKYVARESKIRADGVHSMANHVLGDTLEEVREKLPRGLHRMARFAEDDPVIVEVWL